ISSLILL
ncbi:hypothetical protein D043_2046B, partial [Vibrio parahaemolyticus EKP-021]